MKKLNSVLIKSLSAIVCSSLFFLMTGAPAFAISLSLGTEAPITGGSWERSWEIKGGNKKFNKIDAFITSGDTNFGHSHPNENQGLDRLINDKLDKWDAKQINEDYSHASGETSDSLKFWTTVSADIDKPFKMDIWLSKDDEVLGGFHVEHEGNDNWISPSSVSDDFDLRDWDSHKDDYDRACRTPHVPEPGTLLLLGSGLLGIAALRKRFKV